MCVLLFVSHIIKWFLLRFIDQLFKWIVRCHKQKSNIVFQFCWRFPFSFWDFPPLICWNGFELFSVDAGMCVDMRACASEYLFCISDDNRINAIQNKCTISFEIELEMKTWNSLCYLSLFFSEWLRRKKEIHSASD